MAKVTPDSGSRRERQRQELLAEIGEATRTIVVEEGAAAVTMAAVAERVGVTAPALYRYVDGRTGLLELGCVTIARRLVRHLDSVREAIDDDPLELVLGLFRELRRWALTHRAEFALVFAHPATAYERAANPGRPLERTTNASSADLAAAVELEVEWLLEEALLRLWQERPFPVPPEDQVPAELRDSVQEFVARVSERAGTAGLSIPPAPTGAAAVLLGFWVRVYGMISMEVFGHLSYVVPDAGPLFEFMLEEFARTVRGSG